MIIDRDQSQQPRQGWPKTTFEQRPWVVSDHSMMSRTQRRLHTGTYDAAIAPEIAGLLELDLDTETLALVDDASAAIVRFDSSFGPQLVPFAAILLRSESAASSKIENLSASAKTIALAELGAQSKENGRLIVANTRAMKAAISLAEKLDGDAIVDTHRALLEASNPGIVGGWRQQQVWIGGTGHGPHRASFVPPHHDLVPAAMADLVQFIGRDDLPTLVHAAIAHAQFETIHPFADGNGRTGRALLHAMLRAKGLTKSVTVPVSAGVLTDVPTYFQSLGDYRDGNVTSIVRLIAESAFVGIENGEQLVSDLGTLRQTWKATIKARSDSSDWQTLDLLLRRPVIDSPMLQADLGISAPNALRAVGLLVDAGVLTELGQKSRNRKWGALAVLAALDAFAERAGRRG